MSEYILAVDEGTTNVKSLLLNRDGKVINKVSKGLDLKFPELNHVECDPYQIWEATYTSMIECVENANINVEDIAGIGISNQRESVLLWEKETGKPVYPYIIWMDKRCNKEAEEMNQIPENVELAGSIALKPLTSYYPAFKIKWILDNVPGVREKAENGELLYGGVETWIIWNLTNGKEHLAELSSACRSLLVDMQTGDWDDKLLKMFDIPRAILPEIRTTAHQFGVADRLGDAKIPIMGVLGDGGASAFGQSCFQPGQVKASLGTSGVLSTVTEDKLVATNSLLANVAWEIDGIQNYTLEGGFYCCGQVVKWLINTMQIIGSPDEIVELVDELGISDGVYFVPTFNGLATPYYIDDTKAMLVGVSTTTSNKEIVRACLESIAYRVYDTLTTIEQELEQETSVLMVDGGVSKNDMLMQFISDICNVKVERMVNKEACSLGAFNVAIINLGWYNSLEEIEQLKEVEKVFTPSMSEQDRNKLISGWKKALDTVIYHSKINNE